MPKKDFSTHSLEVLTTEQALADVAAFVSFFRTEYNLTAENKIVTFGGSYPGMMAAWSRLFYPELIHASIASSAPVEAQLDYTGYLNTVAASMANTGVGGSPMCAEILKSGYAEVGEMLLDPSSQATLEADFNVCPGSLENKDNWVVFTETLGGLLPVQENDPACTTPVCNIDAVCKVATQELAHDSTPYAAIVQIYNQAGGAGGTCLNVSNAAQNAMLADPNPPRGSGQALDRAWTYLCCTMYAFWQTCEPNSQCLSVSTPFVNNIASYQQGCTAAYGISPQATAAAVKKTNAWSGGATNPKGSRVLWANGGIDPWHVLSVLSPVNGMPTVFDPLSSHHFWTHVPLSTDAPGIVKIRAQIAQQLEQWL